MGFVSVVYLCSPQRIQIECPVLIFVLLSRSGYRGLVLYEHRKSAAPD